MKYSDDRRNITINAFSRAIVTLESGVPLMFSPLIYSPGEHAGVCRTPMEGRLI